VRVELVEIARHDVNAAIGKLDGLDVCVGDASQLVGKKVKVRIERVLDGTAYAALVQTTPGKQPPEAITAEAEAEKPTRKPPARKSAKAEVAEEAPPAAEAEMAEEEEAAVEEPVEAVAAEEAESAEESARRKTRRGSRGGRRRKKPGEGAVGAETEELEASPAEPDEEAPEEAPAAEVRIHVPSEELGREDEEEDAEGTPAGEGADGSTPKRRTRRGSRGGRNRRKKPTAASDENGTEPAAAEAGSEPVIEAVEREEPEPVDNGGPGYVPMSEWIDDFERGRG
jgi:ribonuclease E